MPPSTLNTAICRFDEWDKPWRFRESVMATLDRSDAELFEQVWREAIEASRWTDSDLSACAKRASSDLRSRFAFLNMPAADAVARAAAYQWR
ncbi:MAG TPA: hypothetical protein VGR35_19345 [Tepidisphaeraceae bacterium]|nr:hypothetical protein [Tepidisphaeraceae bacterium]